jgi:TM2 domain-containing membrane protein YozV
MKLKHKIIIITTIIMLIALLIEYIDYEITTIKNQIQYLNNYSICIKNMECKDIKQVIENATIRK